MARLVHRPAVSIHRQASLPQHYEALMTVMKKHSNHFAMTPASSCRYAELVCVLRSAEEHDLHAQAQSCFL